MNTFQSLFLSSVDEKCVLNIYEYWNISDRLVTFDDKTASAVDKQTFDSALVVCSNSSLMGIEFLFEMFSPTYVLGSACNKIDDDDFSNMLTCVEFNEDNVEVLDPDFVGDGLKKYCKEKFSREVDFSDEMEKQKSELRKVMSEENVGEITREFVRMNEKYNAANKVEMTKQQSKKLRKEFIDEILKVIDLVTLATLKFK